MSQAKVNEMTTRIQMHLFVIPCHLLVILCAFACYVYYNSVLFNNLILRQINTFIQQLKPIVKRPDFMTTDHFIDSTSVAA